MDIEQALNRVIELAFKWRQKHEWTAAFKAAKNFCHHRDQSNKDLAIVLRIQEGKSPSGQLDLFQHGATRHEELSEHYHAEVITAHSEFIAMENLLCLHAPQFLELVPSVNFFIDVAVDHSQQIRDLKKLEGAVRSMMTPQKQTAKQTIEQTIPPAKTDDDATKLQAGKKPWTDLATDLKGKWFSAMRKKQEWIPRTQFLIDFFNGTEGRRNKWKGVKAGTEDKRFSDNPDQWKAESVKLKASFNQAAKNRR